MRVQSNQEARKRTDRPLPKVVWHYTSFNGMEGILRGAIWASNAAYLNDTKEFRYAIEIATEEFKAHIHRRSKWRAEDITEEHMARYRMVEQLRTVVGRQFTGLQGTDVFVTSFSAKADHLSQWRAYGDAGPSFSVGFDTTLLCTRAVESGFDFDYVRYGRRQISRELGRLLAPRVRAIFDERRKLMTNEKLHDVKMQLADEIRKIAAFTKDESFADEVEWRLVRRISYATTPSRPVAKFRESGSLVVPYVEIPLHDPWPVRDGPPLVSEPVISPICAITIGPSPHPKELEHAVERMVTGMGFQSVKVTSSKVPFRNW
jgi:hypothetical protein